MVIWITGLSGSGKTTLAVALHDLLKPNCKHAVLLDGDVIRAAFGAGLGYSEPERVIQIQRIQNFAKVLADQELIVIVAALYAHKDLLSWNRANLPGYFEVYLDASMALLEGRDQKNLYSKARSGETSDVVGFDIPWHTPDNPDMQINADAEADPIVVARQLIDIVPTLSGFLA
jgi:cytidine diphosphoramidate kinase